MTISISKGNSKMGSIASVSLPAGCTCRKDAPCFKDCYARKLERLRPSVRNAYQKNLDCLNKDGGETYWREVEVAIMTSRFFRFHVSGDIPDMEYLMRMMSVARRNKHCEILCFTKKYNLVNTYLKSGRKIPKNFHMIFSGWKGLQMDNPYNLPEAHVIYRDETTTARPGAQKCSGNCTECSITNSGCWALRKGEQITFNQH